jgi:hypothetical protein
MHSVRASFFPAPKIFAEINSCEPGSMRRVDFSPPSAQFQHSVSSSHDVRQVGSPLAYADLLTPLHPFPPPTTSMSVRRLLLHPSE